MRKRICVIGAGMGGLAAGIYGQRNGFETKIFESHIVPGGQCTGWKRNGYVFDGCIHYFGGSGGAGSSFDDFWTELGAFPCRMLATKEAISAYWPDGTAFHDYFDIEALEAHMKGIAPEDAAHIDRYLSAIRLFMKRNPLFDLTFGTIGQKISAIPAFLRRFPCFVRSLEGFSAGFSHPLLRGAFPYLHYSAPRVPLFLHVTKHADAAQGSRAWPEGGSLTIAKNMASRYERLGGEILYGNKVARILTDGGRATGVELENGTKHEADYVISDADGRKTIMDLLGGKYLDRKTRKKCEPLPDDKVPWAVAIYLGVRRDLSECPSVMLLFLEKPETLCGCLIDHIEVQTFGFDPTMAPRGKGVLKVELFSPPSYFARLIGDRAAYEDEKAKVAERVIELLERHFPGLGRDIETMDVTTLKTWERYMGGSDGFNNFQNKPFSVLGMLNDGDSKYMLPGLDNFYFVGQWVSSAGALFLNALSGKTIIRKICRKSGRRFSAVVAGNSLTPDEARLGGSNNPPDEDC
jgi:phytoene dehydrogenase-like protein